MRQRTLSLPIAVANIWWTDELPAQDKTYRKYAHGVDRALVLFETALEEWADYISFLNRLLKVGAPIASAFSPGAMC